MACFVYHTRSWQKVFVLVDSPTGGCSNVDVCFSVISHRNRSPSCKSSLGVPFQAKVQKACFLA
eukprot:4011254-Ditylum_brightwellii.AAC.1